MAERLGTRVDAQRGHTAPGDVDAAIASLVAHYEAEGRLVLNLLAAEVSGAGTMLPRAQLTPTSLAEAVHGALARKGGAERVAEAFRAAGGAARAAHVLAGLIEGQPRAIRERETRAA